jgi:hypothetical protein
MAWVIASRKLDQPLADWESAQLRGFELEKTGKYAATQSIIA